jgi:hypothetical protein
MSWKKIARIHKLKGGCMGFNIKKLVDDLCFNDEDFEHESKSYDFSDVEEVETFVKRIESSDEKKIADETLAALKEALAEHEKLEVKVTKEEMKEVYLALKDRLENPRGHFDSGGRFYVRDRELINVRSPSVAYPYSEMNAARTAKFVKQLAEKYKCQNITELKEVAFSK